MASNKASWMKMYCSYKGQNEESGWGGSHLSPRHETDLRSTLPAASSPCTPSSIYSEVACSNTGLSLLTYFRVKTVSHTMPPTVGSVQQGRGDMCWTKAVRSILLLRPDNTLNSPQCQTQHQTRLHLLPKCGWSYWEITGKIHAEKENWEAKTRIVVSTASDTNLDIPSGPTRMNFLLSTIRLSLKARARISWAHPQPLLTSVWTR